MNPQDTPQATPQATAHTAEPWFVSPDDWEGLFVESKASAETNAGRPVCLPQGPQHKANAARIVACVNFCAGINPAAVPAMIEALEALLASTYQIDGFEDILAASETKARAALALAKGGAK